MASRRAGRAVVVTGLRGGAAGVKSGGGVDRGGGYIGFVCGEGILDDSTSTTFHTHDMCVDFDTGWLEQSFADIIPIHPPRTAELDVGQCHAEIMRMIVTV